MAGTWLEARSESFFFWQNFRIFARKSVFCYRTPDFVNGPFVALAKAVDLAPSDPFFDFSFPSYGRFREGDPPTQQKVLPHPTVGALTDSNSPSALSARTLRLDKTYLSMDKKMRSVFLDERNPIDENVKGKKKHILQKNFHAVKSTQRDFPQNEKRAAAETQRKAVNPLLS